MACGRREALRRQALDIAGCSWVEDGKSIDWDRFIRTGAVKKRVQTMRWLDDPAVAAKMAELDANGGVLKVG